MKMSVCCGSLQHEFWSNRKQKPSVTQISQFLKSGLDVLLKLSADLSLCSRQPSTAWWVRGGPGPPARLHAASGAQSGVARCPFRPETVGDRAPTSNSAEGASETTPCAAEGQVSSVVLSFRDTLLFWTLVLIYLVFYRGTSQAVTHLCWSPFQLHSLKIPSWVAPRKKKRPELRDKHFWGKKPESEIWSYFGLVASRFFFSNGVF